MFAVNFLAPLIFCALPFSIQTKGELRILNEGNWQEMLEGEWMVKFYAPWCPACREVEPTWKEFSEWSDDLTIKVGDVDITTNPGLSGRFVITALPTIYHVKDGVFRQYRGSRDKESFISFIEDKKWTNIETIPSWKAPQSFQMTSLSYFFKMSMVIRTVHNTLIEEYGIPYWGSYILFGLTTILIGAILGLIIVCVIDFICPASHSTSIRQPPGDAVPEPPDNEFEGDDVVTGIRDERETEKDDSEESSGALRKRKVEPTDTEKTE